MYVCGHVCVCNSTGMRMCMCVYIGMGCLCVCFGMRTCLCAYRYADVFVWTVPVYVGVFVFTVYVCIWMCARLYG